MAININAKTSGVGGLETTADNSGNINIQSGGSTVMSVTSSGVAVTGSFSQNGAVYSTQPSFRNLIINGDMRIDQRNAGASITPLVNPTYTIDRWFAAPAIASKFSVQQSTTAPTGFSNSLLMTSLAATTVGASDYYEMYQAIEGYNMAHLNWGTANAKTVTLSFWVRSSLTGTFGGTVLSASAGETYPFTYTISSADTWEQKSITILGPTSGTFGTTNTVGCYVGFNLGAGTSVSGTAGSWQNSFFRAPSGTVQVVATSGATFYITGVQLEVGSTATDFENLPYDVELARCQRYYAKTYNDGVNPGTASSLGAAFHVMDATMTYGSLQWSLPVKMRATPTTVSYSPNTGASGKFYTNSGPGDINSQVSGWNGMSIVSFNVANVSITATAYIVAHITASAEL